MLQAYPTTSFGGTTAATHCAVFVIFFFSSPDEGEKTEDTTKLNYPLADEEWGLNRVSECLIEIGKANSSLSCIQLPDFKLKSSAKVR